MRRVLALVVLAALGGCAMWKPAPRPAAAVQAPRQPAGLVDAGGTSIERVAHRIGVSSSTVEALARQYACSSAQGAGLVTDEGPVEVYRMQCADGKVFMARCELRQCRKM